MTASNPSMRYGAVFILVGLCLTAVRPAAAEMVDGVTQLQSRWAEVRYQLPEPDREKAFENLAEQAEQLVAIQPDNPDALIWQGIILSTYAGEAGGLGALGLCKQARTALERALALDPKAMHGSAYTSLGALYYQVPGWPVGFGSDKKAREMLLQGLKLNPDGIDSNYFYGDFLIEEKDWAEAKKVLEHALDAAPRPGREVADAGRRKEIQERLALVHQKLD